MNYADELELVQKALGLELEPTEHGLWDDERDGYWLPLVDDGDNRRVAVSLGIDVFPNVGSHCTARGWAGLKQINVTEEYADHPDKFAAVRHAVWKVAVEVAKWSVK